MLGSLALILHAHLPFVRHPEHERFLEESWLYEAVTETYLPLLQVLEGWMADGMETRLTLTLSPTLCAMLLDPLLQARCARRLDGLVELAEKEVHRTRWERSGRVLAEMYHHRFSVLRSLYREYDQNLVSAFGKFQEAGRLQIITCAATHALLPLLQPQPSSIRAQIRVACDHYRECFRGEPRGIWLPECAYTESLEPFLHEAKLRWFMLDTHGVLLARPRPRYGVHAPLLTPRGLHVFGRDPVSAKQVWSRHEGYPGDVHYRDFYRDIGFDLDFDYVRPYLPSPDHRGFTGFKYHRITGASTDKGYYDREAALRVVDRHADHFVQARVAQIRELAQQMDRPPIIVAPYDAELFGHWWYEGPEFLDLVVRKLHFDHREVALVTPEDYLRANPVNQVAHPASSTWGEHGHLGVWLNETNDWILPHLLEVAERMNRLVRQFPRADGIRARALTQAAREVLLAQASDWPFILRTGSCPDYARERVRTHLLRFLRLHEQIQADDIHIPWLESIEQTDNLFPHLDYRHWQ